MIAADAHILTPAHHLELIAFEVAALAAAFVREHVGRATEVATKSSPTDVVTQTDRQSEQHIRDELLARCPGSTIIGEEFDDQGGHSGIGWIVDPIDGTVNFLYDLPVVAVSIAATIDGVTVAGAVADILRGETFSTRRGGGARRDGVAVAANQQNDLSLSLIGTGFSYDSSVRAQQADALGELLPACRDIRCMGSAALNLCWVACGRLDAYYEQDLKLYDYAAGALIAEEAGAEIELPRPNERGLTLCAAPGILEALRSHVAPASK